MERATQLQQLRAEIVEQYFRRLGKTHTKIEGWVKQKCEVE